MYLALRGICQLLSSPGRIGIGDVFLFPSEMLSAARWDELEPLIEARRPGAMPPPRELRRTISVILWHHRNGAKWRAISKELRPWWQARGLQS